MLSQKRKYGSLDWFTVEYSHVGDDPWGLSWRPSQAFRYQRTLSLAVSIPAEIGTAADVGCATGDFTFMLSRRLPELRQLLGVDFVTAAVERARGRYPGLQFVSEPINAFGARYKHQFDLVICLEVLYYLDPNQRASALASLKQALREGGYVIFSSFISKPPYFAPDEFCDLIAGEFEVVQYEILHLRIVNAIETFVRRGDKVLTHITGGRWKRFGASLLARVPETSIQVLERGCARLSKWTASHTLVLARKCS